MNSRVLCFFTAVALSASSAFGANFVQNGSFESGGWTNTSSNYMALNDGSTAITHWTVSSPAGPIVWAQTPTGDGYSAAQGTYFVDLSGFGTTAASGALQQTLNSLVLGATYSVTLDSSGTAPTVYIGSTQLSLSSGGSFTVDTTPWTALSGTFIADSTSALLTVANGTPTQSIIFVDDIAVNGPTNSVPDSSATLGLLLVGLSSVLVARRAAKQ